MKCSVVPSYLPCFLQPIYTGLSHATVNSVSVTQLSVSNKLQEQCVVDQSQTERRMNMSSEKF